MAELVGGALLSGFFDVLFDRLASREVLEFFQGKAISMMLDELKVTILAANALLIDAEVKQFRDQNVKNWLDELKEVIYEVDHVMDKINTEALRCKIEGGDQSGSKVIKFFSSVSTLFSAFDNAVKSEMEDILRRLKLLLSQKDFLGLSAEAVDQNRPTQRIVAPLVEESDVYGRDAEKEAIVKLLLSDDVNGPRISVLPIVGMGGIGKTTLAQLVYRDMKVEEYFDLKAWVTISEEFDVLRITKEVFEAITGNKCDQTNLFQLQEELKKKLNGKKFLFVLDDVWNENYQLWDALKSPFESGAHRSKIIVTTRSTIVASKMGTVKYHDLQTMDTGDCWKLFTKHVFNSVDYTAHSDMQEIGVEIVKKCKGLPLAVKSIAGLLRSTSDPNEWRKIQQSDVWELQYQEDQKNKIPPALWLSYHFLHPPLKRCFVYCSIFPKDYEFHQEDRKTIVLLWMAEGLLQPQKGKRMEDVGEEYLNALISRSFFQLKSFGHKPTLILLMHDLVHDLAIRMSGEFCALSDGFSIANDLARKTNHLSYRKKYKDLMKLEGISKDKCLRSLLALPLQHGLVYKSIVTDVVLDVLLRQVGRCLRMLSLSESSILQVPDSIGNLKYLRYLDLSGTNIKEVPNSVCTLHSLQTLLLSHCKNLEYLPKDMYRLINLRHLVIRDTPLKEMPPLVSNMKNLQTLSDFVLSEKDGQRIRELGDLQLHGGLCILGLENVEDVGDAFKANLKNKDGLEELVLRWAYGETNDTAKEKELLDALQPHTNMKVLVIDGFRGINFSDWVTHQSFRHMVKVQVQRFRNCCFLPPFGQLPSLEELVIKGMEGVASIGDEFCGTFPLPFPSLKRLVIDHMDSLEKWSFTGADQGVDIFPRLKRLEIRYCEKLTVGLVSGCFPSLESVCINHCRSMVSVYQLVNQMDAIYPCLKSLVITHMDSLEKWSFAGADQGVVLFPRLESLEIIRCRKLTVGLISGCFPSLEDVSIHGCRSMVSVFPVYQLINQIDTEYPCLKSVSVGQSSRLESFSEVGLPSSLKKLSIGCCKRLFSNRHSWNLQRISSLQRLNLWENPDVSVKFGDRYSFSSFPEEGLLPTTVEKIYINGFGSLKGLNGKSFQCLTSLRQLRIFGCKQLQCLPEEGLPSSLTHLEIVACPLRRERCQRGIGQDWSKIQHIPTIMVDDDDI